MQYSTVFLSNDMNLGGCTSYYVVILFVVCYLQIFMCRRLVSSQHFEDKFNFLYDIILPWRQLNWNWTETGEIFSFTHTQNVQ